MLSCIHVHGMKLQFQWERNFYTFFSNRIDGMLLNITSNSSKPVDINNGTVLLDRQRRFTFEDEENSVALISLQYDSGEYIICSFLIALHAMPCISGQSKHLDHELNQYYFITLEKIVSSPKRPCSLLPL